MRLPVGRLSTEKPFFTRATPKEEKAPPQYVSGVEAVMPLCAGVGKRCAVPHESSSNTQSALPAVCACMASKSTFDWAYAWTGAISPSAGRANRRERNRDFMDASSAWGGAAREAPTFSDFNKHS